jgi:hypothetical protein
MEKEMKGKLFVSFLFSICFNVCLSLECNCDKVYSANANGIAFIDGNSENIKPGSSICFRGGVYGYIRIVNVHGTPDNPIYVRNCGGVVRVDISDRGNHGIVINNSSNIILSGSGVYSQPYGFHIYGDPQKQEKTGLAIGYLIKDIEIEHFKIHDVELGLHLVNVPTCDSRTWSQNWTTENISIHDLYIRDTRKEGMYVGSSKYSIGYSRECNGEKIQLQPVPIKNVQIFRNRIENTGWDSFQISMALRDCEIYENTSRNFGMQDKPAQRAGIVIGGGSSCNVYRNLVENGKGDGIDVFGIGNIAIYNNIIKAAERQGIFIGNRPLADDDYYYKIIHNTIVNSGEDGIRYNQSYASYVDILNNLIVASGQKSVNIVKGKDKGLRVANNMSLNTDNISFVDSKIYNSLLKKESPAVDAGISTEIDSDYYQTERDHLPDVGAVESDPKLNLAPVYLGHPIVLEWTVNLNNSFVVNKNLIFDPENDPFTLSIDHTRSDAQDWLLFDEVKWTIVGTPPEKTKLPLQLEFLVVDPRARTLRIPISIVLNDSIQEDPNIDNIVNPDPEIFIYPTPVRKYILLETTEQDWQNAEVFINDSKESLIFEGSLRNGKLWIDLSSQEAGEYEVFISVSGVNVRRIIKKI